MAHPDDVEFMAGGLVASWARQGVELHYCILTDGNSGSRDPDANPGDLARTRRAEQEAAGALLNVRSITFLGHTDGRLVPSIDVRLQIARVIRTVQPDTILTCDPQFYYNDFYINHPDHRAAADATLAATMPLANTRLAAPELLAEGLEPHDVRTIYMAAPIRPTHWIAITEEDFTTQLRMMEAHTSQLGGWDYEGMLRRRATESAQQAHQHGIDAPLVEAYVVVRLGG